MLGFVSLIADAMELMARGGGGGSGGSDGGAGGSGGGSAGAGIMLVGYIPMHFLSAKLRNRFWDSHFWILTQVLTWAITVVVSFIILVWLQGLGFFIGIGALIGTGAGLYGALEKLRQRKTVEQGLALASQTDATWDEATITRQAADIFLRYQNDWSRRDWQNMASYMTPRYTQHATLMIAALLQAKRINNVRNPIIDTMMITEMHDSMVDGEDTVTVSITAHADDVLIDETIGNTLFTDTRQFTEYWHFQRVGDSWLLDGIDQQTANFHLASPALRRLAADNGYFYSLDWGWLLIPRRGDLFGSAKFGTSDINNHIIGVYNNTYLLQLYTYNPFTLGRNDSYLIAQTNVPKEYGRIVVYRKKWFTLPPSGLRRISMEWGDFNKKYTVYASSNEGVTSFELLHPAFMEKFEALPFEVNLEVVDNIVYMYAPHKVKDAFTDHYQTMLALLQEAYKQMRL